MGESQKTVEQGERKEILVSPEGFNDKVHPIIQNVGVNCGLSPKSIETLIKVFNSKLKKEWKKVKFDKFSQIDARQCFKDFLVEINLISGKQTDEIAKKALMRFNSEFTQKIQYFYPVEEQDDLDVIRETQFYAPPSFNIEDKTETFSRQNISSDEKTSGVRTRIPVVTSTMRKGVYAVIGLGALATVAVTVGSIVSSENNNKLTESTFESLPIKNDAGILEAGTSDKNVHNKP